MSDSFANALRERFAEKLGVEPQDILDVRVEWDDGDNYDPTYGSELTAPTFRVVVQTRNGNTDLDIDFAFTELLRFALGIPLD